VLTNLLVLSANPNYSIVNYLIMPGGKISKKEVVRLVKKFKKSGEKHNTKAIWFSLNDIREIAKLIENLNDPASGKTGDGVRLYYGRYPDYAAENAKGNKNTILFVPTYSKDGGSTHHDYISAEEVKKLSEEIGDPDSGNENVALATEEDGKEGYNHGDLCPSDCDGATVGGA
jgi:hypothetical protein